MARGFLLIPRRSTHLAALIVSTVAALVILAVPASALAAARPAAAPAFTRAYLAANVCDRKNDPLVDAANATVKAGRESSTTTARVTIGHTKLFLKGGGGYNHATADGWQHLTLTVSGAKSVIDEIFICC